MKIRWLKSARDTRQAQLDHIAKDSVDAALRMDERIERQISGLADYPLKGRIGRVAGTRELVIARTPFIVVYRVGPAGIDVLRVLHGAQQWPPRS